MNLSTAELMALEVLRGNLNAAIPLADHLVNDVYQKGARAIPPIHKTVGKGRLKCLAYIESGVHGDAEGLQRVLTSLQGWLARRDETVLVLTGISRVELYEFPDE